MSSTTENLARIGEALAVVAATIHRTNAKTEAASDEDQARSTLSALADVENLRVQAQVEAVYAGRYEAGLEPDEIAALLGRTAAHPRTHLHLRLGRHEGSREVGCRR